MEKKKKSKKVGRKSYYDIYIKPRFEEIFYWLQSGDDLKQVIAKLGISESAFYKNKEKYKEFDKLINEGRIKVFADVTKSLYQRAIGNYETTETKTYIEKDDNGKEKKRIEKTVKTVAPDVRAAQFVLINRLPDSWKLHGNSQEFSDNKLEILITKKDDKLKILEAEKNKIEVES